MKPILNIFANKKFHSERAGATRLVRATGERLENSTLHNGLNNCLRN
jgi:hypothetical protein